MDKPIVPTLPVRQPKRKNIFAIRLTEAERDRDRGIGEAAQAAQLVHGAAFHSGSCEPITAQIMLRVLRLKAEHT